MPGLILEARNRNSRLDSIIIYVVVALCLLALPLFGAIIVIGPSWEVRDSYRDYHSETWQSETIILLRLRFAETVFGTDSWLARLQLGELAQFYYEKGRYPEAEPLMRRAIALDEKTKPKHLRLAGQLRRLARVVQVTERSAEAEELLLRAIGTYRSSGFPLSDDREAMEDLRELIKRFIETNRLIEAELLSWRLLRMEANFFGGESPFESHGLRDIAALRAELGDWEDAARLHRKANLIQFSPAVQPAGWWTKRHQSTDIQIEIDTQSLRAAVRAVRRAGQDSPEALAEGFEMADRKSVV